MFGHLVDAVADTCNHCRISPETNSERFQLKAAYFSSHASDIETLILGNSHAYYGLDPNYFTKPTFNGAMVAQSLDLDADIFFKYAKGFTKLKYLIIPISDMSFYFRLGDYADWRLKNYAIYYGIHHSWNPVENSELLNLPFSISRHRLISYYLQRESALTSSGLGNGTDYKSRQTSDLDSTAEKFIQQHRLGGLYNFEVERAALERMLRYCQSKGIKVIMFIPPAYRAYTEHIDTGRLKTTLNTCHHFEEQYRELYFFNLLNDSLFVNTDYYDVGHLNEMGAKKLSLKIDSILEQLN